MCAMIGVGCVYGYASKSNHVCDDNINMERFAVIDWIEVFSIIMF